MIRTIIVDDERLAREELKKMLENYHELEIIDEAKNADEAMLKINELKPDLLFLDVQMPGMTGFDLLKQLEDLPQVVFVTAYDEFAMDAFDVKAIDYILKPVEPKRLDETIKKIIQNQTVEFQGIHQKNNRNERLLTVNDSIFIKDNEKCFFLPLAEVRYFESEGNYIKVYFGRNKPLILRSLNSLEERLDSEHFFRANRKHLVNTKWVEKVEPWFNGGLLLELKLPVEFTADQREPEKIEISRRQTIRFKDLFSL